MELYERLMFAYYLVFDEEPPIYRFCNPNNDKYIELLRKSISEKKRITDDDLFAIWGNNYDCINKEKKNTKVKKRKNKLVDKSK